jgi:hypothetical protein
MSVAVRNLGFPRIGLKQESIHLDLVRAPDQLEPVLRKAPAGLTLSLGRPTLINLVEAARRLRMANNPKGNARPRVQESL